MMELLLKLLNDAAFSAVPAVGFAMVFNVPRRFLPYCALAGALGHSLRTLLLHFGMPIEWCTFAAAALVGVLTIGFAKKHLAPPLMYAVAAIIPMIPGTYAYNTVIALVQLSAQSEVSPELTAEVISNGLKTIFILGALSVGLAMPSLLYFRTRPVI
ncbi:threonine/serine exporter family protein [Shewanella insulae]|uniref:threonine/serine exporter family protein n=1 Tax=Shewanella TaxID=22 RepID=UPI0005A1D307|nr:MULTISPECIES: threonine/serine exporter family protein [Shewanella]KIO36365.1 membrane protein [Shewanella sp. cp20]MCG9711532.1 threonine/serine exporter family protein [Shewanella insulae]MCG9721297.1 threonine/serine exporter family protein [Shewanella sp. Isolate7]MCG9737871.1 threonine/serine exporter family protein [Shewanella insulae]MCG9745401.1 threonine/serine exporter family protein [Shewanella sp. Isolate8]